MSVDAAAEEQFGPYLVYERLGVGGMATVHRALEQGAEGFERMVALKRLLPHLAEDASFIKSFVREAKLASLLSHVNIVQIYELGRVGTEYFISMEYIDGRDLRRILRHARKVTGPPPINITVGLMLQLCDALDYAHNKVDDENGRPLGLVHRDISPSNLIITGGGHLKIIDFGIAKAQSSQLRTQTGRVKGKLAYMAPEAVSGSRDLDARSDIWACGVILHELLTARPLFASKNEYQTLLKVQRGDILPPSTFNQACPPELDAIVFRALARDADQRFANAAELRAALIKLEVQQSLQTGYRDVASWLDWAFGLEAPASFSNNPDSSGVSAPQTPKPPRAKTPRPARNTEEDEAVEVVWGGGNVESENGPVVLEDVPDVSEKHQRPKRDTSRQFDDIPTPPPSEGTMPSIYDNEQLVAVPQVGHVDDAVVEPTRTPRATSRHTIPRRQITGMHDAVRETSAPRRQRTTAQGVPVTRSQSDRMRTQPGAAPASQSGPIPALDAPQVGDRIAAQRARDTAAPKSEISRADSGAHTNPEAQRLPTAPGVPDPARLFDAEAAEALANVSSHQGTMSTFDNMPASDDEPTLEPSVTPVSALPSVPVVRFSKTTPPPLGLADANRPPPSTKPGIGPARALTAPRAQSPSKPPSTIRIGASIAARSTSGRKWLLALAALVLVGGGVTALAMTMGKTKSDTAAKEPAPRSTRDTGTVRFLLDPADAEIKIAGALVHTGSPFSSQLPAGVHQVEIHRQGYKAWLTSVELSPNETQTLRVVLEPLGATLADASLMIATTPPGLEVLIDGQLQAQRTPFKATLKPGPHRIAVRKDGIEVWHQQLTAEPSSDYEFNPSFTADKLRERVQRATRVAPPPPATVPAGSEIKAEKLGTTSPPAPTATAPAHAPAPPTTPSVTQPIGPPATTTPAPSPATARTTAPAPKPTPPPPVPRQQPGPTAAQPAIATTTPPAAAVATPRSSTPPIVPPVAVKKVSGEPPSIAKHRNMELPASVAAKLCIDDRGKVTSADIMSKLDRRIANDITAELRTWRYAPYQRGGTPSPACFVVTLRTK
jgi:eukaryotic-like serine/threonine-protein kinase